MKKILIGFLCLVFSNSLFSQVTSVDYWVDYDEINCEYLAYLIINEGSATTQLERYQATSALVLATPKEMTITSVTSIAPAVETWIMAISELAPANYPDNNYYQILGRGNPPRFHNNLAAGDTILLFTAQASHDMHGPDGVRVKDDTENISITNNFKLGNGAGIYSQTRPQGAPDDYAEVESLDLYFGTTQSILPTVSGVWTNSNPAAATLSNDIITPVATGTSIFTFDPDDAAVCESSTLVRVGANDPISEVDYRIVFNETTGLYNCNVVINEGAAISNTERIQFGSTFSVVIPVEASITSLVPVAPVGGGWEFGVIAIGPTDDPLHSYYQITTDGMPIAMHNTLLPNDEITLFTLELDYNFHAQEGMRNFINGADLPNYAFDISNDFNVGAVNQSYTENLDISIPSTFLEFIGNDTIFVAETTSVSPSVVTDLYESSDPSIATVDAAGVITGVSEGNVIITYTPVGGQPSSLLLVVEGSNPISEVNYIIEFDTTSCLYNCSFIAEAGNAISMGERLQGFSTYSIAVPSDVSLSIDASVNPPGLSWEIGQTYLAPAEDPDRNFYQIKYDNGSSPPVFHDEILEGDTVLLFALDLSYNTHGPNGIRNFINDVDLVGVPVPIHNQFAIGANTETYIGNKDAIFPLEYASAVLDSIDVGSTTTVSPTDGVWTTNGSSAATFDPSTFTVTGQEVGTIVLTRTSSDNCTSSVVIKVGLPIYGLVSEVDYQVKFNEETCNYDCYLKVITGSAYTQLDRVQYASSYTLVTAAETSLTFVESYEPGTTNSWFLNQAELAPAADTTHNFYHIITSPSGSNLYPIMNPGDEVLLFSVSLDDNLQGLEDGIRIFDNVVDQPNVSVSMINEFNIGGPIGGIGDVFSDDIVTEFPTTYAESPEGIEILTGQTISLSPSTGGIWSSVSSDVNVTSHDASEVTAIGEGYSIFTFDPTDEEVCESSVVLHVTTPPHDPISEVDYRIRFNEDLCNYEALLIVNAGDALTLEERIVLASTYTVVTPPEVNLSLVNSVNPIDNPWMLGAVEESPATDPDKNFYQFVIDITTSEFYDFLYETDTLVLFTFEADYNIHYSEGIRNFKNDGTDTPMNSLQNEFNIGGVLDQYQGNVTQDYPTAYADTTDTSSIFVGLSTLVTSPIAGDWSSSDNAIATVDPSTGEVTGAGLGSVLITLTPTDTDLCSSSVIINVVPHPELTEVEYILIWDEAAMNYKASMIAVTGNAISNLERIQLAATFSVVTPSVVTPTIVSTNPGPSTWEPGDVILSPPSDPLHNFYQFTTDGQPTEMYDIILEGDTIELFRINMDYTVHGSNGLRILENGVDLVGNPLDINNEANIGGITGQYQQNAPTILPLIYADTNTEYEILTGATTNVIPVGDGTWTNTDSAIASRDASGLVTGLTVGTSILTYTPSSGEFPSSVVVYVNPNQNSTVTKVDYKIELASGTCNTYNCYMVVVEGAAYSTPNLIQTNGTFSIVTPKDISLSFDESFAPGTSSWGGGDIALSPPEDPSRNFYSFYPTLGSDNIHDPLEEGDEVLLFTVTATGLAQGPKGTRLFENDIDLPGASNSFLNGFTMGGPTQLYNANQEGTSVSLYAEAIGPSDIIIGGQTTIIPYTDEGSWANSDPAVASLDADNIVTGLTIGTSVFTFTPNNTNICASQFSVNVLDPTIVGGGVSDESWCVAIGADSPHHSSLLEVYSTEKGILIPRMTQEQRLCIVSPANGLLVFQNDQNVGFYYFNGASWTKLDDTLTNGSSSLQSNGNNDSRRASDTEFINSLISSQELLEKKLKVQKALIEELTKKLNDQ